MKRLKKFLIYAIIVAAFWIFSNIIIHFAIKGTFKTKDVKINVSSPQVTITENKATYINGVVKGSIKNNTDKIINDKYLKIDMYSKRDVNLGTKYVKIDNLKPNQTREFEMWHKYTDVNYVTITIADEGKKVTNEELLSEESSFYFFAGKLMYLFFFL